MTPCLKLLYFACGILNFLIAIFVIRQDRASKSNQHFFYFLVSTILWTATLYLGYLYTNPYVPHLSLGFIRGAYGTSIFMGFFLVSFFYYYPRVTFKVPKWVKWAFLIVTVGLAYISTFTPLVHEAQIVIDNFYGADKLGPWYMAYLWYFVTTLVAAGILAFHKMMKAKGIERSKIKIVALGCWVFLFLAVLVNVILPAYGIYLFLKQAIVFALFFTIPTFYSMQKYRFFHFSYISLKLFRYVSLLAIFFIPLVLAYQNLPSFLPEIDPLMNVLVSAALGLAVFGLASKMYPSLQFGQLKKFNQVIDELVSRLYYAETYGLLHELLEDAFVMRMNLKSVKLMVVRSTQEKMDIPVYERDGFTEELAKHRRDILLADEIEYLSLPGGVKNSFKKTLEKMEASVCLPFFSEKTIIGLVFLGRKSDGTPYSKEEINQIVRTKKTIEVTLMNILLKSNLQEENNLMKSIIREKTEKLQKQFNEIKRLLNLQSDFLAVTAHELRTPLNIAMFQLEDTLDTHRLSPDIINEMKILESSLHNLKGLTQRLFDVQQYDLNKVKLNTEEVDVGQFLERIFEDFKPIMKNEELKFEFNNAIGKGCKLEIDEAQLRQVIHNLLTNTCKFVPKDGGKVDFSIVDAGDDIIIKIADNGKGIEDENKQRIFEKFQSEQANQGMGIGLGLYLCKKIIELHEGEIWVEDTEGGGATFCIRLPK